MTNELTITISSTDSPAVVGGRVDTPPSPLPLDEIGVSPDSAGLGGAQSSSPLPVPLPLDRLLLENSQQDSSAPGPAQLAAPASSGDGAAPSPLPLEELAAGEPEPGRDDP
jgi:hypothetical protein